MKGWKVESKCRAEGGYGIKLVANIAGKPNKQWEIL